MANMSSAMQGPEEKKKFSELPPGSLGRGRKRFCAYDRVDVL